MDHRTIGVGIQAITPTIAVGLKRRRANGLVICDVLPDGTSLKAGLKLGDIILPADGKPLVTAPQLQTALYTHDLN